MIRLSFSTIRLASLILLFAGWGVLQPAWAQEAPEPAAGWSPLDLYQRFISGADGQRCPMYPSCSHYARQSFKMHGLLKGWILTCDRLLRCGRDETRTAPQRHGGAYDPLAANTFWWDKKVK